MGLCAWPSRFASAITASTIDYEPKSLLTVMQKTLLFRPEGRHYIRHVRREHRVRIDNLLPIAQVAVCVQEPCRSNDPRDRRLSFAALEYGKGRDVRFQANGAIL